MDDSVSTSGNSLPEISTNSDTTARETKSNDRARLQAIDWLRGAVIMLMALDHVRDFFTDARYRPLDLSDPHPAMFLTRWITHFCAPTFVFLAGVSAYLLSRRLARGALSRFLLVRGLWLVLLELTVVRFAWSFNLDYSHGFYLQVIWAIGMSMVALAALVYLPARAIGAFGVLLIVGHNAFDHFDPVAWGISKTLWSVLHVQGPVPFGIASYPLVPWIGVMALGFALGSLYDLDAAARRRIWRSLGVGCIAAFVVLRASGIYGDPSPWVAQSSGFVTFLAFLNVTKYPPSLLFLLMTLGPMMLALAAFERAPPPFARVLSTFGRVPLFAYVVHLMLAHLLAGTLAAAQGFGTAVLTKLPFPAPQYPEGWGLNLAGVYVAWLVVLAMIYPACRWFADLKRRRNDPWLSFL